MAISLFSVPTPLPLPLPLPPHQARLYKHNSSCSPTLSYPSSSLKLFVPLCSPSSTSSPVIEEEGPSSQDELPLPDQSQYATIQSGCKACGREEIENGCNGEGRIQGGIATVPGFGWWPIKAYRPCPGFVASGGRYRRKGQSMDEVASGGSKTPSPSDSNPSNKKQDPKK